MKQHIVSAGVFGLVFAVIGAASAEDGKSARQKAEMQKKARMMQMMQGKKAKPLSKQYPAMTYVSVNDRLNKNTPRYDLASCGQYFGGPQGSFIPADATPPPGAPPGAHGMVGGGITSNCNKKELFGMASIAHDGVYVRGLSYLEDVGSYKDGDGNKVRYGFSKNFNTLTLGFNRGAVSASLTGGYMLKKNVLFGGASADTKEAESKFAKLRFSRKFDGGALQRIVFSGLIRGIDKTNDNFSNRTNPAGVAPPLNPPHAEVNVERMDYRARLRGEFRLGRVKHNLGIGFSRDNRDALRVLGGTQAAMAAQSQNFPDTLIDTYSVFLKSAIPLNAMRRFKTSIGFDHVRAQARKANIDVDGGGPTPTPNQMWVSAFGATGHDVKTENNVSASLRFEQDLMGGKSQIFIEGGRTMRSAGPRERYFANFAAPAASPSSANNWLGNPDLKPEAHHKVEAGFVVNGGRWNLSGKAYFDMANNYIIHDRSHGVNAALLGANYNIYRNVDARIFAAAGSAGFKIRPNLKLGLWGQYTHATNRDSNSHISQIPPLEGHVTLDYTQPKWSIGARLRGVARQARVDDNIATGSGNDDGSTKSFATVDIYGAVKPLPMMQLKFGVENLLDKTYLEHIERTDIGDPNLQKLNAPGRTLWARASLRF